MAARLPVAISLQIQHITSRRRCQISGRIWQKCHAFFASSLQKGRALHLYRKGIVAYAMIPHKEPEETDHSRRKASMGLRRAAWTAGTAPKKRPTTKEKTTVAATMYQLMKMGTPETRDTM